ncbi:MAG: hypothetical protein A2Z21_09740 [Candidatus Fraserbacteria bacterium RBG_16_55_9]|uniref:Uncharacterized protein n=1 Tax=Fraserbacteria sp. (strain RBG_16_55_9) TaxID=1817864 RepID=A0A1F5UQ19_FRAXR|nr:MAG: hypothetical protein A2Z21_09740 [Candidatus Fraserbacteria bacterium RBG_16_55_9]
MAEPAETSIPPITQTFILCDQVITDEATKKKTLIGVFDRIWVSKFPAKHTPAALYIRLFDAQGDCDIRVDYVKVDEQTNLGQVTGKMQSGKRHTSVELAIALPPIEIPAPGEYEFRLWINELYSHRVRFVAEQLPTGRKQP